MTAKPSERVRVERASAERLLGSLPDRSIDLLITDPPYVSVNRSGSHLRDWFADGLTWVQIGRVFAIARRKLKADGVLMAMTNNDGLREAIGALERAGFVGIRTITWDRQYPGLGSGLRHQCEFVLVGRLPGSRTLAGVDLVSVAAVGPGTAGRYPTAKPDGLGRELAAMAGIGRDSLVVDPFCGSGALLVGAVERGATVVAGDVAQRAIQQAAARLAGAARVKSSGSSGKSSGSSGKSSGSSTARSSGRSNGPGGSSGKSSGSSGKPNGSSGRPKGRSGQATVSSGKSSGSSGKSSGSSGKPNGSSGKPNGSSGKSSGSSGKSSGSSGKPNGSSTARSSRRPNGSSGQSTVSSGKPNGSSRPGRRP